jgi:DNA (cytosine-5)-methyltransferase 1
MGYARAGFEVVGVDINPQPNYPFEFHQDDAMTYPLTGFDAIHASPPCQAYSMAGRLHPGSAETHPDLLAPTRERLRGAGAPYVIENVDGSPIAGAMLLCGSMFGLRIAKHRLFETSFPLPILAPASCDHRDLYDPWHGEGRTADKQRVAQDTPWLPVQTGWARKKGVTGDLNNAIPPAYTEWIGAHLLASINQDAAA